MQEKTSWLSACQIKLPYMGSLKGLHVMDVRIILRSWLRFTCFEASNSQILGLPDGRYRLLGDKTHLISLKVFYILDEGKEIFERNLQNMISSNVQTL